MRFAESDDVNDNPRTVNSTSHHKTSRIGNRDTPWPTFIDESGEPGTSEASYHRFLLGAVWFESYDAVQAFNDGMAALRRENGLSPQFEFHFALLNPERKAIFFNAIARHPFKFVFCSFEKHSFDLRTLTKNYIRESTVKGLVEALEQLYREAEARKAGHGALGERIVCDECNDPQFAKLLKTHFRSLVSTRGKNKKLIADVNFKRAKTDSCLQLADMLCGVVRRHLDGCSDYYDVVKHKVSEDSIRLQKE